MSLGKTILGRRQCLPTVPSQFHEVMVEGTFPDGTFLVTVHEPVSRKDGDMDLALYGSFLPVPKLEVFGASDKEEEEILSGQVLVSRTSGPIHINVGRERIRVKVTNNGDRPVQVYTGYYQISSIELMYAYMQLLCTGWKSLSLQRNQQAIILRPRPSSR